MNRLFLFLIFLIYCINLQAQTLHRFTIGGYVKDLELLSIYGKPAAFQWTNIFHNRINFKYTYGSSLTARLESRNLVYSGRNTEANPWLTFTSGDKGFLNTDWNLLTKKNISIHTTIDRALISYSKNKWEVTLGKQRINWGINLTWNPNDIFNTYNLFDFDYEERPGNDAIRIQFYPTSFQSVEFAVAKGRNKADDIYALLYKFNKYKYDFQILGGVYKEELTIGAGWAGNISKAGFKGELSYFNSLKNSSSSKPVFTGALSGDYTFNNGYYINASVLYNSEGGNSLTSISEFFISTPSPKELMPFKYTGLIQASKAFSLLFSTSLTLMYSPSNDILILIPTLNYSLSDSWEVSLTDQSLFTYQRSQYDDLIHNCYLRLRWSF